MKRNLLVSWSVVTLLAALPLQGSAQTPGVFAANPGQYTFQDTARLGRNVIEWSSKMQQQDQDAYNQAKAEADAAYKGMFGTCTGSDINTCTGLQKLRRIHIETMISRHTIVPARDLAIDVQNFMNAQEQFAVKLAAIESLGKTWQGMAQSQNGNANLYQKGSINLTALTNVYRDAITAMAKEAAGLTYKVDNNAQVIETKPGMGLDPVDTVDDPKALAAQLAVFQKRAALTDEDRQHIGEISVALSRQLAKYLNVDSARLYWFNDAQKQDGQDWVKQITLEAQIFKYVKARWCVPLGVPAMDIPKVGGGYLQNVSYLIRGGSIRMVPTAEFDPDNIRETLTRLDAEVLSLKLQNGDFNDKGGFVGFVNRVNSTLTWHNEVGAYLSVINIIRDILVDEIALASNPLAGCEEVRASYFKRFGSMKDEAGKKWAQTYVDPLLTRMNFATSGNEWVTAFGDAGQIVLTKGKYIRDLQLFQQKHPDASATTKGLDDDSGLQ
jgi:hypothetical protein